MDNFILPDTSHLETEDAKQVLRSAVRAHRKQISEKARKDIEPLIQQHVKDFVKGYRRAACYVSTKSEPPTIELCAQLADSGVELILPKLGPGLTRSWGYFKGVDDLAKMAPCRPPEPTGPAFDNDILSSVDVLIMPALAVNDRGERLGQGGGWYDRALKAVPPHAKVAALVFEEEFVSQDLPQDDHDVRVGYVITPSGIHTTSAAR